MLNPVPCLCREEWRRVQGRMLRLSWAYPVGIWQLARTLGPPRIYTFCTNIVLEIFLDREDWYILYKILSYTISNIHFAVVIILLIDFVIGIYLLFKKIIGPLLHCFSAFSHKKKQIKTLKHIIKKYLIISDEMEMFFSNYSFK